MFYEKALSLNENHEESLLGLGRLYDLDDFTREKAIVYFRKTYDIKGRYSGDAAMFLGEALEKKAKSKEFQFEYNT